MITFRFFDQIPQMPASSSDDGRQSGMCQMRHHREIRENKLLWSRRCLVSTMRKCWQPTRWPHVVGRRLGVQYACECRESDRASTKFFTAATTFSRFGHATLQTVHYDCEHVYIQVSQHRNGNARHNPCHNPHACECVIHDVKPQIDDQCSK